MTSICYFLNDIGVAGGDPACSDASQGVGFGHAASCYCVFVAEGEDGGGEII